VRDDRVPLRRACYATLVRSEAALDPERLPVVGSETRDLRRVALDWVSGWQLHTGDPVWVPADAVLFRDQPDPPWHLSSNGLASGNCLSEALAHAVAELIERDARTVQVLATEYDHLPHTLRLVAGPPRVSPPPGHATPPKLEYPFVDLESLPEPLLDAARQIHRSGAAVDLRWIASDVAVPVFDCLIYERQGESAMLHAGAGAHPDATVAARRALTEAAQSRATFIQGVREDLRSAAVRARDTPTGGWFDASVPRVDFADLPTQTFGDVVDDLRWMVAALERAGLSQVIAVDLSHPELPFAVARVIVPGLEAPLDLRKRDRVALGWRARRLFEPRLRGGQR
jgi:ribosomal protein S12 methylthiotransferase accessory factor